MLYYWLTLGKDTSAYKGNVNFLHWINYSINVNMSFRNKGTHTVEEELLQALKLNNLITDEGFEQVQTVQFQRAARTDKGVSALRQIISLLLRKLFSIKIILSLFYSFTVRLGLG